MQHYETVEVKLGQNKGAPRVWLEGKRLLKAGFAAGAKFAIDTGNERVVLRITSNGTRIVSAKHRADEDVPVIDLNSASALGVFAGLERLRVIIRKDEIHLLPLATQKKAAERIERLERKLKAGEPLTVGSLCHGGGVLSLALHNGLHEGGVETRLAFANDIDAQVLEHASSVNPVWDEATASVAAPMQEIVADNWLLNQLGSVEILEAGIPCVAASLSGRAKKGLSMAEADPNAGHLVVPFLAIVQAVQPCVVVVENVPPYQNTASAHLIRNTLRDWGYTVQEDVLAGGDFGAFEDRKRMVMVATTAGLAFDFTSITKPAPQAHTLAQIMEDIPENAECWSTMQYLRDKEVRDKAAGKGFRMQIVGPNDSRVGTIGAEYQKNRSTEPKVRHPVQGDCLLRLLTPTEHARIKGVPEQLIAGLPATRAHHLLGNGICFGPFLAVGKAIALMLLQHAAQPSIGEPPFQLAAA